MGLSGPTRSIQRKFCYFLSILYFPRISPTWQWSRGEGDGTLFLRPHQELHTLLPGQLASELFSKAHLHSQEEKRQRRAPTVLYLLGQSYVQCGRFQFASRPQISKSLGHKDILSRTQDSQRNTTKIRCLIKQARSPEFT